MLLDPLVGSYLIDMYVVKHGCGAKVSIVRHIQHCRLFPSLSPSSVLYGCNGPSGIVV